MTKPSITFGGYQGDNSVHTRGANVFCDALTNATAIFRQDITKDGHKASELFSMTESGALDGCYFSSSYLTERVPELSLLDLHFALADRRQSYAILDGQLGKRLATEVEAKTGFKVLGYWDNGVRHISTADKVLTEPSDCAGLKLRTLASDDHKRVFKALGFEPVNIDVRDLAEAVESGRVDAQENPLTNIYNFGLHKTHRHVTLTGHLMGVALVLFNRATFEAWPDQLRADVEAAIAKATKAQRRFAEEDDVICARALKSDGVTLAELSEAQRAKFEAAAKAEVDKIRSRVSPELIEMFEQDLAEVTA